MTDTVDALEQSRAASADITVPAPDGLEYMPFQLAGIQYAMQRDSCLIGDEMGLGKTIQALGLVNADDSIRSVLVLCPASLRINWAREANKWLIRPFDIMVCDGKQVPSKRDSFVVCNYSRLPLKSQARLLSVLMSRQWDLIVLDECHYLKNPKAKRTKTVLGWWDRENKTQHNGLVHQAKRRLFLTGTPFLNRPVEIQPILAALDHKRFGNFFGFAKRYCNAHRGAWGWDFTGSSNLDELQDKLRTSVMVRRMKKDVLTELPAKRRQVICLPTNGAVRAVRAVRAEQKAWQSYQDDIDEAKARVDLAKVSGDRALYAAEVERLQYLSKAAFDEMAAARKAVAKAKLPASLEHIDQVLEQSNKVILFAWHHDIIDQVKEHYGHSAVTITGKTANEARQRAVDRFQDDASCRVFIGNIKAAGVGLTLTAASTVVFLEEDRAHRIGQTNSVLVQHLVLDGSIDARMADTLVHKQNAADKALDTDTQVTVTPSVMPPGAKRFTQPKHYPTFNEQQTALIVEGIRMLASWCDGAVSEDEAGFNKYDTFVGRSLAKLSHLTPGQTWLANKLCRKYRRQLPERITNGLKLYKANNPKEIKG
jgi:SWI/SNF-related matrix-associated actin-dependent regulator 1 of chromatin subfamily A